MNTDKSQKLSKFIFILNGTLFLATGYELINTGEAVLGTIQLLAAAINLFVIIRFSANTRLQLIKLGLGMNVIVTASVAYDYFQQDKQYIQYAWVAAAAFSLVALVMQMRRK